MLSRRPPETPSPVPHARRYRPAGSAARARSRRSPHRARPALRPALRSGEGSAARGSRPARWRPRHRPQGCRLASSREAVGTTAHRRDEGSAARARGWRKRCSNARARWLDHRVWTLRADSRAVLGATATRRGRRTTPSSVPAHSSGSDPDSTFPLGRCRSHRGGVSLLDYSGVARGSRPSGEAEANRDKRAAREKRWPTASDRQRKSTAPSRARRRRSTRHWSPRRTPRWRATARARKSVRRALRPRRARRSASCARRSRTFGASPPDARRRSSSRIPIRSSRRRSRVAAMASAAAAAERRAAGAGAVSVADAAARVGNGRQIPSQAGPDESGALPDAARPPLGRAAGARARARAECSKRRRQRRARVSRGCMLDGKWAELLEQCETVMASPQGRGWLDLQRYVADRLRAAGRRLRRRGGRSRAAELRVLLAALPQLAGDDAHGRHADRERRDARLAGAHGLRGRVERRLRLDENDAGAADSAFDGQAEALGDGARGGRRDERARRASRAASAADVRAARARRWRATRSRPRAASWRAGRPNRAIELLVAELARERSPRGRFVRQTQIAYVMVEAGSTRWRVRSSRSWSAEIDERRSRTGSPGRSSRSRWRCCAA